MVHVFYNSANRVHNDPSRLSKVANFDTNRNRAGDFLVLDSNLGPIWPSFRD